MSKTKQEKEIDLERSIAIRIGLARKSWTPDKVTDKMEIHRNKEGIYQRVIYVKEGMIVPYGIAESNRIILKGQTAKEVRNQMKPYILKQHQVMTQLYDWMQNQKQEDLCRCGHKRSYHFKNPPLSCKIKRCECKVFKDVKTCMQEKNVLELRKLRMSLDEMWNL